MKADSLAIIDENNQTQWVQSASTTLSVAASALAALQAQTSQPLLLVRSFTDKDGKEELVEYLTEAATALTRDPHAEFATIEVWHADPPDFMYDNLSEVQRSRYKKVALVTIPRRIGGSEVGDEALLDDVYSRTQNIESAWNPPKPCRSTSQGDVLVIREGSEWATAMHAVSRVGFTGCRFV